MLKHILALLLSLFAAAAFAAVDANKATQADLESIKGIGPVIATKILDERKKAPFKDWEDMIVRVKGVGDKNAAKFSTDGLTVNGAAYTGAPAAAKAGSETKTAKGSAKEEKTAKAEKGAKTEKTAKEEKTAKAEKTATTTAADDHPKGKRARASADAASTPAKAASAAKK